MKRLILACPILCLFAGCGGDAQVELAASDSLLAVAGQMELAIQEYHDEVLAYDDWRESAVVSAFIDRVKIDSDKISTIESHADKFKAALGKIRTDRETEWTRRAAVMENVGVLRELSSGLQKLAIESLTLKDEMRRYLTGWIETRRRAEGAASEKVRK